VICCHGTGYTIQRLTDNDAAAAAAAAAAADAAAAAAAAADAAAAAELKLQQIPKKKKRQVELEEEEGGELGLGAGSTIALDDTLAHHQQQRWSRLTVTTQSVACSFFPLPALTRLDLMAY
jgi:hypothetical protein